MGKEYQKFPISNFRTGFNESVEPWLLPRDAYQQMINTRLYRGVLEKTEGYSLYANMSYRTQSAMDQVPNGIITQFTLTLPSIPTTTNFKGYGSIIVGTSAETFVYGSDASATLINLTGSVGGVNKGTVNLSTLVVTLNFTTAPPVGASVFFEWDSAPAAKHAIMCIGQYYTDTGGQDILIFDTRRVGKIISIFGVIAQNAATLTNQGIGELPHEYIQSSIFVGTGAVGPFTGTLSGHPLQPGSVQINQYNSAGVPIANSVITDNGFGRLSGTNVDSTVSYINYTTGAYTITFTIAPSAGNIFNSAACVFGDLFTGDFTNFFTLTNFKYKAFFTNNVDHVMYYDGMCVRYLNTSLAPNQLIVANSGVPTSFDISRCLHVVAYRERLLLLSPTVVNVEQVFTIYWSKLKDPLDFTENNFLPATTSEPIRAFGLINTDLVIRFASSERIFRYTGDTFDPFRFDSTNNIWDCDGPYSSINYDTWYSTVGKPGIVGSDGVNVKRVDEIIPDFTDPTILSQQVPVPYINQNSIGQCYGERFDDLKEGWLCYNSAPQDQSSVTPSDNVLTFNYLDSTYSVFSFPFSCLGFGRIINVPTWGTTYTKWEDMSIPWGSFEIQKNSLVDLAGDQFDKVYILNTGNTQTVAGDSSTTPTPVLISVITKNFNPFIEDGQLATFGYIDLLVSAYDTSTLRVQFYVNDQLYVDSNNQPAGYYKEVPLQFKTTDGMSPSTNQTKVWKRIYVNSVGKSHTIRFYQNILDFDVTDEQPIFIHAMVLYMKPAGLIFN